MHGWLVTLACLRRAFVLDDEALYKHLFQCLKISHFAYQYRYRYKDLNRQVTTS
jgi:hypothetical protein